MNIIVADGFEIVRGIGSNSSELIVEFFIIYFGERYDFILSVNKNFDIYLLVVESIEDFLSRSFREYYVAEVFIYYKEIVFSYKDKDSEN